MVREVLVDTVWAAKIPEAVVIDVSILIWLDKVRVLTD